MAKYGELEGGWCSRKKREPYGLVLWKGISMGCFQILNLSLLIMDLGPDFGMMCHAGERPTSFQACLDFLLLGFLVVAR